MGIVVIGDKSAGKSSVIEGLMGIDDLLPKGDLLKEKCPLVIKLKRMRQKG